MCEIFAKLASQIQVALVAGFLFGLAVEYFPVLESWTVANKALLTALISLVVALSGFGLGALQSCWLFTFEAATPFIVSGFAAAVASLGGEGAVVGTRAYRARNG